MMHAAELPLSQISPATAAAAAAAMPRRHVFYAMPAPRPLFADAERQRFSP